MPAKLPIPYAEALLIELESIRADFVAVLEKSGIYNIDPNRGAGDGIQFLGYPTFGWAPSNNALQSARMALLGRVRAFRPRFELLFPHPTPEVRKRHGEALNLLERWLQRGKGDRSVPRNISTAVVIMNKRVDVLVNARDLLPADEFATRVVVDTNVLIDNPDLTQFGSKLGGRYMVHVLPVVLRELDDLKRSGRTEGLREAAKRADRRLKMLRDNGDVTVGAKVAGDVWAVFEHVEPRADGLPTWLDLDVPDDRFIASALLLQSRHPRSMLVVGTSDLNLQTKLAAVRLAFIDPS